MISLEALRPWTTERVPLWRDREVLISAAGAIGLAVPVFVLHDTSEFQEALALACFLRTMCRYETVALEERIPR